MPRKNQPQTLQPRTLEKLCIDSATEMLCHLNESNVTDEFPWLLNKEENPFFSLPNSHLKTIIQNFISTLCNHHKSYCKKTTFLALFCQQMVEIDLSPFSFAAEDYLDILDWMEKTSSDVKYFQDNNSCETIDVPNMSFLKIDVLRNTPYLVEIQTKLIKLILSMKSLTHLVLNEFCNDRVLDAIGKGCPNITHLYANSHIITDLGLQSLCMNVNDPSDKKRRCQNIESLHLNFDATGVTDDGIKMLLKYLPQLKFINNNNNDSLFNRRPSTALIQMHEEDYMMCEQIYQLKEFSYIKDSSYNPFCYNSEEISAKAPKILSKIAPYITTLRIENATEEELIQFGQLQHVENLTLEDYHNSRNMFNNGILLLLEKIGSNLRNLYLYGYEMKDLLAIGILCPKLEELTCYFYVFNPDYPILNYHRVFQNLKTLKFYSEDMIPQSSTYLRKILKYCEELKTLIVGCFLQLTEDDLVEMIKEDLASVEYLHISHIPRISISNIEEILSQENDLKTFKLTSETYFDEETLTRIKQIIKENNLNLCFEYCKYSWD